MDAVTAAAVANFRGGFIGLSQERLSRWTDHDREIERDELSEPGDQFGILLFPLPESDSGVRSRCATDRCRRDARDGRSR